MPLDTEDRLLYAIDAVYQYSVKKLGTAAVPEIPIFYQKILDMPDTLYTDPILSMYHRIFTFPELDSDIKLKVYKIFFSIFR